MASSKQRQLGSCEEIWTRCTAGGTGIGIFGIALKQSIEIQSVVAAAKAVCENHALLRAQIARSSKKLLLEVRSDGFYSPVVESLPWPDAATHNPAPDGVFLLPGDDSDDRVLSQALHRVVTSELNLGFQAIDSDSPVDTFQIHVYNEPSGCYCIVILRFHSGACDRASSAIAAREFIACLDRACRGQIEHDDALPPVVAAAKDRDALMPCMEDLIPKNKASSKGFFKKGLDAVGYALNSTKSALLPFNPTFAASSSKHSAPFRSEILSYNLGAQGTEELIGACKKENTTIAAALSAAFVQTAARVKELKDKKQDTFSFTNVLDCRSYFEPPLESTVLGNFSAGLPHDEQVKENVAFWDLARHISAATEKSLAKNHQFSELPVLNMLLSQVLKHPSITPGSSGRTALFTVFVDGPLIFNWSKIENLKIAGTLGPLASMHFVGPCFSIAESLLECPQPELCLTFVYADPIYTRPQLESFFGSALELLKSVA